MDSFLPINPRRVATRVPNPFTGLPLAFIRAVSCAACRRRDLSNVSDHAAKLLNGRPRETLLTLNVLRLILETTKPRRCGASNSWSQELGFKLWTILTLFSKLANAVDSQVLHVVIR